MDEDIFYSIELNYRGIKMIHEGLSQAVEKWAGGHPDEQRDMIMMRDNFYRLLLEYQFEHMN